MSGLFLIALAGILIWLAVSTALKGNAKNPVDALQHVSGFAVSVVLVLILLVFGLPMLFEYMAKEALPRMWGPVITDTWDETVDAGMTASDLWNGRSGISKPQFVVEENISSRPVLTNPVAEVVAPVSESVATVIELGEPVVVEESLVHVVVAGDSLKRIADQHGVTVDDLVQLNSIQNRNNISVGQRIVVKPEVTVVPTVVVEQPVPTLPAATPTPTFDWSIEYQAIERAKANGDIESAVIAINTILRGEPTNVIARTFQQEIELAYGVIEEWGSLSYSIVEGSSVSEIRSALAGFEFEVAEIEGGWNVKTKREEAMVLTCISENWMHGRQVSISRYMGESLGFHEVGDAGKVGK